MMDTMKSYSFTTSPSFFCAVYQFFHEVYQCKIKCDFLPTFTSRVENSVTPDHLALEKQAEEAQHSKG